MRCFACNKILTPQEATRRFKDSGEFVDMCTTCLNTINDEVETTDGFTGEEDNWDKDESNYE